MAAQSAVTLPNVLKLHAWGLATCIDRRDLAVTDPHECTQIEHLPLPSKPWQPRLTRQQLLHRGLLDSPFFGNQRVQCPDQLVNIGKDGRDGTLFRW